MQWSAVNLPWQNDAKDSFPANINGIFLDIISTCQSFVTTVELTIKQKANSQTLFQIPPHISDKFGKLMQPLIPPRQKSPFSSHEQVGPTPEFQPEALLSLEEKKACKSLNQQCLDHLLEVVGLDHWEDVTERQGVKVWKRFLPSSSHRNQVAMNTNDKADPALEARAAKFAAVKAYGVINAPVEEVYKLFLDNARVKEYNDQCAQVRDLEYLSKDTKVTWACTPRYGPIKARDFCTVVHYRQLSDGTYVVVNRPAHHEKAQMSDEFVRSEILIAGNIMRPNDEDPENKTDFFSVTHVNPGGICDSKPFAMVINALCANGPISFIRKLETAARRIV